MPTTITPALPTDITTLIAIRAAAYAPDRLHTLGLPNPMTDAQNQEYRQYQLDTITLRFTLPNRHYFKAVDSSTGEMVGFSCWTAPARDGKVGEEETPKMPEMPAFVQKGVFDEIGERFKSAKGRIVGEREDFWYLQAMVVSPEYQRRGIGDQLLKQGLRDLVDRDGLDCYLEASEVAARLYERNGFDPEIPIQIEVEGGIYTIMAMLRKARR